MHTCPVARLVSVALLALLSFGCKGPISKTSRYARPATSVPTEPAADKSLVFFHRPRSRQGYGLYANIWDGHQFIADLGNGHSSYYECAPGEHFFILRSAENTTTIQGRLAAGETYDFVVRPAFSWWVASFKLEAVDADHRCRDDVLEWTAEHLMHEPIQPVGDALRYQEERAGQIDTLIGRYDPEKGKKIGPGDER